MSCTDLYGIQDRVHADVNRQIAELMQLTFELRQSSFWGEYDIFRGRDGEEFRLLHNVGDPDEDMLFPDFPAYPVILEVTRSVRDEDLHARLLAGIPGLVHLSSKTW